ncbi:MAG: transcriptional regulator [Comamonadaceae bacterium]|nr:MAG: transcriptional regulator [Comamonadaceae bacterium]
MKPLHGLVIGKFYPPHAGHKLLVSTAARQCAQVSVIVMAASHESIDLHTRVRWMREIHAGDTHVQVNGIIDDVPVDYGNDKIWDQHVALMKQALDEAGAPAVDVVFTSEPYGSELAGRFGARSVTLDVGRVLAPISATRVRADVPGHWDFLEPPVRAGLALRVVVVGAESTGTTTLSKALAGHLRAQGGADGLTRWVPEYGRDYSVQKYADSIASAQFAGEPPPGFEQMQWQSGDFTNIAQAQCAMEDEEAARGGPVLICDTDAFATTIWHERYLGSPGAGVEALAAQRKGDLYLLTHHDGVPFEQDGIRDGEAIRAWMTQRFLEKLAATGRRHVVLHGSPPRRLAAAIDAVASLRAKAWTYAAPLG